MTTSKRTRREARCDAGLSFFAPMSGRVVGLTGHRDARASLTLEESKVWRRVHRLDQLSLSLGS
jgi:hypothetical protein